MDDKKLDEIFDKFFEYLNEKVEDENDDLKDEEFEEAKQKIKKDMLEKIDDVKDVLIVVADDEGSIVGGKMDIISSVLNLVDNVYDRLDKSDKKNFRRCIEDKIFNK